MDHNISKSPLLLRICANSKVKEFYFHTRCKFNRIGRLNYVFGGTLLTLRVLISVRTLMRSPAESKILLNILWCYKFTTAFDCYEITLSLFYSYFFGLSLIYALITCPYSCRDILNFRKYAIESDFMNISSTYIFKSKSGRKRLTMN